MLGQLGDAYQAAGQPLEAGRCRRGAEETRDEIRRHDDSGASAARLLSSAEPRRDLGTSLRRPIMKPG